MCFTIPQGPKRKPIAKMRIRNLATNAKAWDITQAQQITLSERNAMHVEGKAGISPICNRRAFH
jgi:hypothetical protein